MTYYKAQVRVKGGMETWRDVTTSGLNSYFDNPEQLFQQLEVMRFHFPNNDYQIVPTEEVING